MSPSGGVRGKTLKVTLYGKNLAESKFFFSSPGISVLSQKSQPNGEQLDLEFDLGASAALGAHELRLANSKGISNGARFFVDITPNLVLEKPMSESDPAIELDGKPIVINSRILSKAGRDRFAFLAKAGETWVFDCFADRLQSRFDPVLNLKDSSGVSLKQVQSVWENDPRLVWKFKKSGRYFLTVHDSEFNGANSYFYRLLAGVTPSVSGMKPLGGQPGQSRSFELHGENTPIQSATLSIPKSTRSGVCWLDAGTQFGKPMLLPVLADEATVTPAPDTEQVVNITGFPVCFDGIFLKNTTSNFRFHAKAKEKILFDLFGRRIGSRIDGELRVTDLSGKEIAKNDDMSVLCKDAKLEFVAPAEGDYLLEARNVEEIFGEDCYYRLKATPVIPDFEVSIETDRLSVPSGGKASFKVETQRIGGFSGGVELKVSGLPKGVVANVVTIAPDKSSGEVTLTCAPNTPVSACEIHVTGEATISGKKISHEAPAWERYEHRSIDLSLSVEYSYTRPHRLWEMLLFAVTDPVPVKK